MQKAPAVNRWGLLHGSLEHVSQPHVLEYRRDRIKARLRLSRQPESRQCLRRGREHRLTA